jgi:signal transduction histidine kinase
MVAEGFSWYLSNLQGLAVPLLVALGIWFDSLNTVILGHLILALPYGRIVSRWRRLLVVTAYGFILCIGLARTVAYDPAAHPNGNYLACASCTRNLFFAPRATPLSAWLETSYHVGAAAFALLIAGTLAVRWFRTARPNRLGTLAAWSLASLTATLIIVAWYTVHRENQGLVSTALIWLADLVQGAIPVGFLLLPLRRQLASAAVADLVVGVGRAPTVSELRDALAKALRDPGLELGFWIAERGQYVDADGRDLELPGPDAVRTTTHVGQRDGTPLAAMVHERMLLDERHLMDGAKAATMLGLENELLQAQVQAQLEEVRASRVRIVEAGDAERRRVERDIHDGAQQRLVSALLRLGIIRRDVVQRGVESLAADLEGVAREVRTALAEVRELARGIHPAALTQGGLAAAVSGLAERAPLPVEVSITRGRYPRLIEATAFFVISEAFTNAARYSGAGMIRICAGPIGDTLLVEVTDDGVGGADPARGTGLLGLQDRAAAVGGTVRIDSPPGGGTCVQAELPCG